jgi:hypothetical protein
MTEACPIPDPAEARAQHRFVVLRELTDLGMGIARDVRRQAAEPAAPGAPPVDFGLQFARIARAVRQTVALEARLDEERRVRREAAEAERLLETRLRGQRRKNQVGNIIEHMLDSESESDAERLSDSLHERLADIDDCDFADRPLGEIVAAICKGLGVTIDWALWEDQPWAAEAMAAEKPAAPFLSRAAGEGDRPPTPASSRGKSGGWRGQASSTDFNTS